MTDLQNSLIEAGYNEYITEQNHLGHTTNILYQKCFRNEQCSKMYYLTVYYYDNTYWKEKFGSLTVDQESLQWEAQFTLDNEEVFEVVYGTKDIQDAEQFFEKVFQNMNCVNYE